MPQFYTSSGRCLSLTATGKKGGEGELFTVDGDSTRVAKIRHTRMNDAEAQEKAEKMTKIYSQLIAPTPALRNVAWPQEALYSDKVCTKFAGFTMKAVKGESFNLLYQADHPKAIRLPMNTKIDLLINLCEATDALHQRKAVIGDFNYKNILYLPTTNEVALLDVDSFHFPNYPCTVCLEGYGAPEIQRASLTYGSYAAAHAAGKSFDEDTDNFALAIHIFRMMMNGVHPFSARYVQHRGKSSKSAPKGNVDTAIRNNECPYFRKLASAKPAPLAPDMAGFPQYLKDGFRVAFLGPDAVEKRQLGGRRRPTAAMWSQVLKKYKAELKPCANDGEHFYHQSIASCPYCEQKQAHGSPYAWNSNVAKKPLPSAKTPAAPTAAAGKQARTGFGRQNNGTITLSPTGSPRQLPVPASVRKKVPPLRAVSAPIEIWGASYASALVMSIAALVITHGHPGIYLNTLFDISFGDVIAFTLFAFTLVAPAVYCLWGHAIPTSSVRMRYVYAALAPLIGFIVPFLIAGVLMAVIAVLGACLMIIILMEMLAEV